MRPTFRPCVLRSRAVLTPLMRGQLAPLSHAYLVAAPKVASLKVWLSYARLILIEFASTATICSRLREVLGALLTWW